jgi:hypothetical protein
MAYLTYRVEITRDESRPSGPLGRHRCGTVAKGRAGLKSAKGRGTSASRMGPAWVEAGPFLPPHEDREDLGRSMLPRFGNLRID